MRHKRFLDGMQLSVFGQALYGPDSAPGNCLDTHLTGRNRLIVNQHRTGATRALSTTEFGTGQPQVGAQQPQKGTITVDTQGHGLVVERKCDGFNHKDLPFVEVDAYSWLKNRFRVNGSKGQGFKVQDSKL
jgi:hypothetical protein